MWRRAQINSPAGTVPISVASSGGAKVVRANLSLSSNGLIDFQDGSSNSLNGGPIPLLAGYPFELGYVDNDDAQQNPVFATGSAGGDAFPFTGSAIDWDFANGRYAPALGLNTTRASVAYEDDLSGNWTQFAANTARITNKGLLVEESRTNSISNNSMQGAVVGTPGTLPTNWSVLNTVGGTATTTVVALGTENGIDYIDLNIAGVATGTGTYRIAFEAATQIAATQNQVWADSLFVRMVGGSLANSGTCSIGFQTITAGGGLINEYDGGDIRPLLNVPSLGRGRNSFIGTAVDVTTAFVRPVLTFIANAAGAYNITFRFGWPQLELGSFATSPIRTTAAAVTRAADVVTVTSPPAFGSAYSLFAAGTPNAPNGYASNQQLADISDVAGSNRLYLRREAASSLTHATTTLAGVETALGFPLWSQGTPGKLAAATQNNDQAGSFNGGAVLTSAAGQPVGVNNIGIGIRYFGGGAAWWDGYITRVAVWSNTRLPNQTLQQLTTSGPASTNGLNLVIQGAGTCTGYVDYQLTSGN